MDLDVTYICLWPPAYVRIATLAAFFASLYTACRAVWPRRALERREHRSITLAAAVTIALAGTAIAVGWASSWSARQAWIWFAPSALVGQRGSYDGQMREYVVFYAVLAMIVVASGLVARLREKRLDPDHQ